MAPSLATNEDLMELFCARQRRKFSRGIKRKPIALLKKLRKAPWREGGPQDKGTSEPEELAPTICSPQ